MKRGFTLVELLATLIVLSVVAIIVVPNLYENVKEVQEGIYATQIQTIKDAAKNWSSDYVEQISCVNNGVTYVFLENLKNGGYIDQDLYKNNESNVFNDNVFVLITCSVIEGNENNNSNYKYTYEVYDTNEKHLTYLAKVYAQKYSVTSNKVVQFSELLELAHSNLIVGNQLKNIEDGSLINNASVVINYSNNEYTFKVNIG